MSCRVVASFPNIRCNVCFALDVPEEGSDFSQEEASSDISQEEASSDISQEEASSDFSQEDGLFS